MIDQDHSKTNSPLAGVAVVLISKFPAAGKVKTRLAPAISLDQAAAAHRCFLLHTVRRVHQLGPAELIINFDPPEARAAMRDLLDHGASYSLVAQSDGDLGRRIAHIATTVGKSHRRILVLGVDSPDVPTGHLIQCAAATMDSQVVLGLADDGGYWCIGLRNDVDAGALLHDGIEWSTDGTAKHTLANARRLGYSVSAGNPWDDVDQPEDLRRLVTRLGSSTDDNDRQLLAELRHALPADFICPTARE